MNSETLVYLRINESVTEEVGFAQGSTQKESSPGKGRADLRTKTAVERDPGGTSRPEGAGWGPGEHKME